MRKTRPGFVEVPEIILNALKNDLFSDKGGVNLKGIVSDISTSENEDMMAIAVALAYKGTKVDLDAKPRYEARWGGIMLRYECVGYSLIMGVVKVKTFECRIAEDGSITENECDGIHCYGFDQWAEWSTDFDAVKAKTIERQKR